MSYFDPHQPRPLEPLVAVFRVLGERLDTLDSQVRIEGELRQNVEAHTHVLNREIEKERRKIVGLEADLRRWRERALENQKKLEEATLPPEVVAVIAAARGVLDGPTHHRLRKLRLAFREFDREAEL